jgi:hypothetical protein
MESSLDRWKLAWQKIEPTAIKLDNQSNPNLLAANWFASIEKLRALFAGYYGSTAVASKFVIPHEYDEFMREFGCGWHQPQGLGRDIFAATTMTDSTAEFFHAYVINPDGEERPEDDGLWLTIGWFSDKHAIVLCCDRAHSCYGRVIDFHDSHPWLNGIYYGSLVLADSFGEWLERMAGMG